MSPESSNQLSRQQLEALLAVREAEIRSLKSELEAYSKPLLATPADTPAPAIVSNNSELAQHHTFANQLAYFHSKTAEHMTLDAIMAEVFYASPDSISVASLTKNKLLLLNHACERLTGYKIEDMIGAGTDEMNLWVNKQDKLKFIHWLEQKEDNTHFETELRRADGSIFNALLSGTTIKFDDEHLSITTIRDISELKHVQRALEDSNTKFSKMFQANYAPMFLLQIEPRKLLDINQASLKFLGLSFNEVNETTILNAWHDPHVRQTFIKQLEETGYCNDFEAEINTHTRQQVPVKLFGRAIRVNQRPCTFVYLQDLSEQKRLETERLKHNADLETAQEIARLGNFELDATTGNMYLSEMMKQLIGNKASAESFDLQSFISSIHPNDRHHLQNMRASEYNFEYQLAQPINGMEYHHLIAKMERDPSGKVLLFRGVLQDITERVRAKKAHEAIQRQLLQTQKLESMGVLAGGIAHDFNNLLTTVLGNADIARINLEDTNEIDECLTNIISASEKAADLTNQLLAYSGRGNFHVKPINLSNLTLDMEKLLSVSTPDNVQLNSTFPSELPLFNGDQSQIQQIVMNLIINAAEAMEGKQGRIDIATGIELIDANQTLRKQDYVTEVPRPGQHIYLSVEDNGKGMSAETLQRLFEPFFSTKFTGRGLGMAAVLGIIRGHNGFVQVYSEPGVGTAFKILFPVDS